MNEQDRTAADDWMRDHLPDPDEFELQDRDSATVVYQVAVKDGKRIRGFTVVLKSDPAVHQIGASVAHLTCPNRHDVLCNRRAVRHRELLFAASKKYRFSRW